MGGGGRVDDCPELCVVEISVVDGREMDRRCGRRRHFREREKRGESGGRFEFECEEEERAGKIVSLQGEELSGPLSQVSSLSFSLFFFYFLLGKLQYSPKNIPYFHLKIRF